MKTCSKCGAPQADTEPFCACCGSIFPGVKKRIHLTGIIGLIAAFLSIVSLVYFFYATGSLINSETLREVGAATVAFFASLVGMITLPFLGFALSIKCIRRTKDPLVKGKTFGVIGAIISSIMSIPSVFVMFLVVIFIVYELDTVT